MPAPASAIAPSLPPGWAGGCALSHRQRPQSAVRLGKRGAYGDERRSSLRIELETRRTREGLHVIGGCLSGAGLAAHGVSNPRAATSTPSTGVRNPTLRQTSTRRERPFLPLRPWGRRGPGRGGGCFFLSLRRRALTPFAWLRANGARRSRAVRSAPQPGPCHGPTPCRFAGGEVNHFPRRRARAPLACLRAMRRGTRSRAPHHGAVEGGGLARQHRLMQDETRQTTTAATFGRSSIARLPPALREAVDAAIADGATIDEITARIRAEGGACSRSAVGRYVKNMRGLIRQQQEADRANEAWVRALGGACARPGGAHPDRDPADAGALRPRRSQPARGSPCRRQSSPAWRWFSGASKAPTSSVSSGERAAAKAARAAPGAGQAPVRKGLSPEAVAAIREVVEGRPRRPARAVTSAPVDPWNPAESHLSHLSQLIPLNPGEIPSGKCVGRVYFQIPRRRARTPLACLRAIRRGAQSRAPDLRSGPTHGEHLVSRRVRRTCAVRAFGAGGRRGDEGGHRRGSPSPPPWGRRGSG